MNDQPAPPKPARSETPPQSLGIRLWITERIDPEAAEALWAAVLGARPEAAATGAAGDGCR